MNASPQTRPKPGKLVFLETFGCQMNDNDSERILGFLGPLDYSVTTEPDKADLIIVNTCSVRDKAEQKVYSMLGRFKGFKAANPGLVISVAGCVAQQEGERLLKRVPYLDLVFGPQNIHRLPELLRRLGPLERPVRLTATDSGETGETIAPGEYVAAPAPGAIKANVSIMRGCDNFCAYCIVPYTRGREVSRASEDIIDEVTALAAAGVKEVTLLGQNVNSYGSSSGAASAWGAASASGAASALGVSFPELLRRVAGVAGIERIRFVTSHPRDISTELIRLFGEERKLARHLHLPVQSGSDRVLEAMGRGYTRAEYIDKVELLKDLYPDIALTTDIIVGFPGETDRDFELTMDLIRQLRYDNIFSFMYSPRPGTRAASFTAQLDTGVKSARLRVLQDTQRGITAETSGLLVGRSRDVLVEGASKHSPDELTGRTTCNRVVNFAGPSWLAGRTVEVEITDAYANSMRGRLRDREMERSQLCS